jgi:hypothetical protein
MSYVIRESILKRATKYSLMAPFAESSDAKAIYYGARAETGAIQYF